jgi:hypothetical protein
LLFKKNVGITFSDAESTAASKAAVNKMDAEHVITGAKDRTLFV